MTVLVAIPYRPGTPRLFVDEACRHFTRMTWPARELAMFPSQEVNGGKLCGTNAAARNRLIENCLCARHTHVLWIDVDITNVPLNLIEKLMQVSQTAAVAPLVYVERLNTSEPPSWQNGGWFYDTGAFICRATHAQPLGPLFDWYTGGELEMESVGCCYLIPADVYRRGLRYEVVGDEVEHVLFFERARAAGLKVLATDTARIEHAYLPRFGEHWHG